MADINEMAKNSNEQHTHSSFPFPPCRVCAQFGPGGETVNPMGLMINMGIQNQNYNINDLQIEIQYFCFEN